MSLRSKSARKKSKDEPDKKDADKEVKDTPKDTKKGASESKTEKGTAAAAEKKDASASSEKHDKGGDKASAAEHHKEEKKGEASEAKGEAKAGDGKADAKTADKNEKEKAAVGKKERSLSIKSKERKKKGSVTDVAKGGSAAATATNDKAKAEGTATATATSTESKGEAAASSSSTASTSAAASSEAKSSGREEELLEQIKEKDKKISELESKLAEAHETIKAKDQTIEDLKKQLAAKGEGAGTSAEGAAQVETVKPTVVGTPSFTSLAQQQKDEPQAQSAVIVGNSPMRKASRAGHVAESAGSPRPTGAAAAADGKKKKKKKDKGKEKDSTVTEESTTAGDLSSPEDSASTPGSTIKASEGATPTVASTDDTSAASASSAAPAAVGGRRLPRPTSDKAVLEPDCELSHINLRKGAGLKTAFHDLNLAVNISGGGTTALGAHTSIVTARCPQFHKTIKEQQEKRKKKGKAPIQLDVRAHDVASVNYLLDFLYCDKVEFPKMSPIDVLHLIIVARAYGLNRLRWIAEDYLLQIINMKNVVELLKQSSTLGEKTVKCICLDFLLEPEHFAQFVQLKESINTLGLELFQEVVAINATKATTGPQTEDRGSCPPSTLRKDFKKLYETMEYSDSFVKLEAKNIPFHKAILAAHSKKLAKAFSEKKKENAKASDEDMTDVLKLVDLTVQTLPPGKKKAFRMSEAAFRSMLKYVYYGETEIDPLPACELVNWAHHYDMSALKKLCEQHIQNGITPGFVINIMAVTYLAIMRERADMMSLRQQCIQFAMENLASIKLERIRDMDGALDIAIDLLLACQKMVQSAS